MNLPFSFLKHETHKKNLFVVLLSIFLVTSCSTRKEIVYFQDIEKIENFETPEPFETEIEVNDVLRITVSSMNEEVVVPFQMNTGNGQGGGGENLSLTGYLVDVNGNIQFPVLGKIAVAGKTRMEIEEMLQSRIREYVTDAVVSVRMVNFRVTVLGEVRSPGRVEVTDGRISVPQALAMSGDITYNGKRENILVIRVHNGKKLFGRVDITEADVFKNPFFYLKQNDILYVEPTYRQIKSAGFFSSPGSILSIISSALSLIFIFTR